MLDRSTQAGTGGGRRTLMISGLVAAVIIVIAALVWTSHEREAARNDPSLGTTSATSPRNPTPAPGGGSDKGG